MILRTRGVNQEVRAVAPFGSSAVPSSTQYGGWNTDSGVGVTPEKASGIPAVLQAFQLLGQIGGSLPLRVYSGQGTTKRTRENSWQWSLLHDSPDPSDSKSSQDFWSDVILSLESWGNAYVFKIKDPNAGRVEAMLVMDPARMTVKRVNGQKIFTYWVNGKQTDYTSGEVIHFRNFTLNGSDVGLSAIQLARNSTVGPALARMEYTGRFWRNDASPPGAIKIPDKVGRPEAKKIVDVWMAHHSGPENAGVPAVLSNGAEWQTLSLPLKDAAFIEQADLTTADVARMLNVPAELLNHGQPTRLPEEDAARRFLNFSLQPRLTKITNTLLADIDFFGPGSTIYPEHFTDNFILADATGMAAVRHSYVQDGVLLVDEVRADLGLPPLPDGMGKIPQITPVGGAPNQVPPPPSNAPANEGASQ